MAPHIPDSLQEKVYVLIRTIPKGKVATYGQIARLVGKPKVARLIGHYMRVNPNAPHTPCHRIVGSDGSLVGYSAQNGLLGKKALLVQEGVIFNGARVDLKQSGWDQ